MRKSGAATDGQAFLAKTICTGMGRTKPEILLTWFNRQKNQCCHPMAQKLRSSPQLLVILLSNLHSSHKKRESFWQIRRVSQSKHNVGKQERRPSLLQETMNGHRQNPPEKIQLLDKVFSSVRGHSAEFWGYSKFKGASGPINKHHLGDICNTQPSLTSLL